MRLPKTQFSWIPEWMYAYVADADSVEALLEKTPLPTDETVQAVADANKEINEKGTV